MNPNLNRLLRELDECIMQVLPLAEDRPNVFNEVIKIVQQLISEIESTMGYVEGSLQNTAMYQPKEKSDNADSLNELKEDLKLVNKLMNVPNRRVRTKMITLKFKTQQAIREKPKTNEQDTDGGPDEEADELPIFLSTLATLKDRPHVWNHVITEVQRLRCDKEGRETREEESSRWSAIFGAKKHSEFDNIKRQPETQRTAGERWQDVERIDEVLDGIPERSSAYKVLDGLKKKCTIEARALQRMEAAEQMAHPADVEISTASASSTSMLEPAC